MSEQITRLAETAGAIMGEQVRRILTLEEAIERVVLFGVQSDYDPAIMRRVVEELARVRRAVGRHSDDCATIKTRGAIGCDCSQKEES